LVEGDRNQWKAIKADASSAYQQALAASEQVPGFHPIPAPSLGQQAFAGTVTMGGETHIGSGVLSGRLIVGVTLAGLDASQQNITNLFAVIGMENTIARLIVPLVPIGLLQPGHTPASDAIALGLGEAAVHKAPATVFGGGSFLHGAGSGDTDQLSLGSGNSTLLGGGGRSFVTAGGGASTDAVFGGLGPDTMHSAGALFQFDPTRHDGGPVMPHFESAHDMLHPVGYGTTHAPGSAQAAGGSMILSDGTTITPQNFTGLIGKDLG
jgi:hypothetical protein